jgi:hypothetical protein
MMGWQAVQYCQREEPHQEGEENPQRWQNHIFRVECD